MCPMKASGMTCLLGGALFSDSSILCIEYTVVPVPGHPLQCYFEPVEATDPTVVTVLDFL